MARCIAVVAVAAAAVLFGSRAEAATYTAWVVGCVGAIDSNETGVFVSTSRLSCGPYSYGSGSAKSDEFGVGADLELVSNTQGHDVFTAYAYVNTDYMITGPAGMVDVELNLELTSGVGGGIPGDGASIRTLTGSALLTYASYSFHYREQADSINGITSTTGPVTAVCSPCAMTTVAFSVPTNTWIPMTLAIALQLDGFGSSVGQITALNTLYFPEGGPVFNFVGVDPGLYSAEIRGLNVVDNRVLGGDEQVPVPEPATLALLGTGLAAIVVRGRRR